MTRHSGPVRLDCRCHGPEVGAVQDHGFQRRAKGAKAATAAAGAEAGLMLQCHIEGKFGFPIAQKMYPIRMPDFSQNQHKDY
jgi:hypothetical protein